MARTRDGRRRRHGGFGRARAGAVAATAVALATVMTAAAPTAGAEPSTATVQAQDGGADVAAAGVPSGGRFVEPVFGDVDVTRDVTYRTAVNYVGAEQDLRLDIYEPSGDTADKRPVLLLAFGGAFAYGDKTDAWGGGPQIAEPWAQLGYVVVSIQYRTRLPGCYWVPRVDPADCEAAADDAYDDAFAAVTWVRDHADEYRLDPDAIVANGWSAGGSLAWALAWYQGSPRRPEPSGIAAAVSNAGHPFHDLATGELPRGPRPDDPPVLVFHGTADSVLAFETAARPCRDAATAGATCELVAFEGVGHPLVDPVNGLDRHAEQIGDRMAGFLAEEVLLPRGYFADGPPGGPTDPPADVTPGGATPPGEPGSLPSAPPAQPIAGRPDYAG